MAPEKLEKLIEILQVGGGWAAFLFAVGGIVKLWLDYSKLVREQKKEDKEATKEFLSFMIRNTEVTQQHVAALTALKESVQDLTDEIRSYRK